MPKLKHALFLLFVFSFAFPSSVSLSAPENNAQISSAYATLSWTASSNSSESLMCDLVVNDFLFEGIASQNGTQTDSVFAPLEDNTVYYWNVTCSDGVETSTSETRAFGANVSAGATTANETSPLQVVSETKAPKKPKSSGGKTPPGDAEDILATKPDLAPSGIAANMTWADEATAAATISVSNVDANNPFNYAFYSAPLVEINSYSVSSSDFEWYECNMSNADQYAQVDDDCISNYSLPWNFSYYGRAITAISPSANGHVELLEDGESESFCSDWGLHDGASYIDTSDVIFAMDDDLEQDSTDSPDNYMAICNMSDKVVIEWRGSTYWDWYWTDYPVQHQLVLFENGTIGWNFLVLNYSGYDYDLYSGLYGLEENQSVEVVAGIDTPETTYLAAYGTVQIPGAYAQFANSTLPALSIGSPKAVSAILNASALNESSYYIKIAVDPEGNVLESNESNNNASLVFLVNKSLSFPLQAIPKYPANGSNVITGPLSIGFLARDMNSSIFNCTLVLDGSQNQTLADVSNNTITAFNLSNTSIATHYWNVNCSAGPRTSISGTWQFTTAAADASAPSLVLNSPAQGAEIWAEVVFNWTATDDRDEYINCTLNLDGNPTSVVCVNNSLCTAVPQVAPGNHSWNVTCTDSASNQNISETRNFTRFACLCTSCADCTDKLNDPACDAVALGSDINSTGDCIYDPANFSSKLLDCQGYKMTGPGGTGSYAIYLAVKNNNTITGCEMSSYGYAIYLYSSNNARISGINAHDNDFGIYVGYSSAGNLTNLNISQSASYNIFLYNSGPGISISRSAITHNAGSGILLQLSNNNLIYDNFFNCTTNSVIITSTSAWNISKTPGTNVVGGPYLGGNFWATPSGNGYSQACGDGDFDGICDSSYSLGGSNYDYYPLAHLMTGIGLNAPANNSVKPRNVTFNWTPYNFGSDPTCNLSLNSTIMFSGTCTNNAPCATTNTTAFDGIYYWNVTCSDGNTTATSQTRKLTVLATHNVVLNAPANNSLKLGNATFNWTAYNFTSDPTCNLSLNSTILFSGVCTNNAPCTTTNATTDGTYSWNVTCSDGGSTATSQTRTVTVLATNSVLLNTPANNSIEPNNATFNWTPYNFGSDPTCNLSLNSTIIFSGICTNNAPCTTTNATGDGAYSWNVTCSDGNSTVSSDTRTLQATHCSCTNCTMCTNMLNDSNCSLVVLGSNISSATTCINNSANFRNKVLDCKGYAIAGPGGFTGTYGVYLNNQSNNSIRNCTIRQFQYGTYLTSSSGNAFFNLTIRNSSSYAVYMTSSSNFNVFSGVSSPYGGGGVYGLNSRGNNFTNVRIADIWQSPVYGVYLAGFNDSTFSNVNISGAGSYSSSYGIYVSGSKNNTFSNITIFNINSSAISTSTYSYGIRISDSANLSFSNLAVANVSSIVPPYYYPYPTYAYGLYLQSISNISFTNITVLNGRASNSYGAYLSYPSGSAYFESANISDSRSAFCIAATSAISDFFQYFNNSYVNGRIAYSAIGQQNLTLPGNLGFVVVANSRNITLANQSFYNACQGALIANSSYVRVSNITVANNTKEAVYLYAASNSTVSNVSAYNNSGVLRLYASPDNALSGVQGNRGGGIVLEYSNNTRLSDVALSSGTDSVALSYSSGCTVSNISTFNSSYGALSLSYSHNNIISNVSVVPHGGIGLSYSNNNSFSDTATSEGDNEAVGLSYSSNNTFSNHLSSKDRWGIQALYSYGNRFSNFTLYVEESGIEASSSSNSSFSNVTIHNATYRALQLSGSTNITFEGLNLTNGSRGIIIVGSSFAQFVHYFTNSYLNGKQIYSAIGAENLTAPENLGFALVTNSRNVTLRNSEFNRGGIILANCSLSSIYNLTLTDNVGSAIYMFYSPNNTITNVTVSGAASNGLGFSLQNSSFNSFRNIVVHDTDNRGVQVYDSPNNDYSNFTIYNSTYSGIILARSNNNTLRNFSVFRNFGNGIELSTNNNTVISGVLAYNNSRGIYFWSSNNATVSDVFAYNNTEFGIMTGGARHTFSNITLMSNGGMSGSGVYFSGATNCTLSNITSSYNREGIKLDYSSSDNRISDSNACYNVNEFYFSSNSRNNTGSGNNGEITDLGNNTGFSSNQSCPPCGCSGCSECTFKLSFCRRTNLTGNISTNTTCINDPAYFSNRSFDCQGNSIRGTGISTSVGISLSSKSNGTISNCEIGNFGRALSFISIHNFTLSNLSLDNLTVYGVYMQGCHNNTLSNISVSNSTIAIMVSYSYSNLTRLSNITSKDNIIGVYAFLAGIILEDSVFDSDDLALSMNSSHNSRIRNNGFYSSQQIRILNSSNVSLNSSYAEAQNVLGGNHTGGNYYGLMNGTGISQACNDTDFDSICDEPFIIQMNATYNITDYYPLRQPRINITALYSLSATYYCMENSTPVSENLSVYENESEFEGGDRIHIFRMKHGKDENNISCGYYINETVRLSRNSGSACAGPVLGEYRLVGWGSAQLVLIAPYENGTYDLCNQSGALVKQFNSSVAGNYSLLIEFGQQYFELANGLDWAIPVRLTNQHPNATMNANLTLGRWLDDNHTTSLEIPSSIRLNQSRVTIPANSSLNISIIIENMNLSSRDLFGLVVWGNVSYNPTVLSFSPTISIHNLVPPSLAACTLDSPSPEITVAVSEPDGYDSSRRVVEVTITDLDSEEFTKNITNCYNNFNQYKPKTRTNYEYLYEKICIRRCTNGACMQWGTRTMLVSRGTVTEECKDGYSPVQVQECTMMCVSCLASACGIYEADPTITSGGGGGGGGGPAGISSCTDFSAHFERVCKSVTACYNPFSICRNNKVTQRVDCGYGINRTFEIRAGSKCGSAVAAISAAGLGIAYEFYDSSYSPGTYYVVSSEDCNTSYANFTIPSDPAIAERVFVDVYPDFNEYKPGESGIINATIWHISNRTLTYNLTLQRWFDNGHTIRMYIPSFLSLSQNSVTLGPNGSASMQIRVNGAFAEKGSKRWSGILLNASSNPSAVDDFDIALNVSPFLSFDAINDSAALRNSTVDASAVLRNIGGSPATSTVVGMDCGTLNCTYDAGPHYIDTSPPLALQLQIYVPANETLGWKTINISATDVSGANDSVIFRIMVSEAVPVLSFNEIQERSTSQNSTTVINATLRNIGFANATSTAISMDCGNLTCGFDAGPHSIPANGSITMLIEINVSENETTGRKLLNISALDSFGANDSEEFHLGVIPCNTTPMNLSECSQNSSCAHPEATCPANATQHFDAFDVRDGSGNSAKSDYCTGERIIVSKVSTGSYENTSTVNGTVCDSDCKNTCYQSCEAAFKPICAGVCVQYCTNGACLQSSYMCGDYIYEICDHAFGPLNCTSYSNSTGFTDYLETTCTDRCFNECKYNLNQTTNTTSYNASCTYPINETVSIRVSDGACGGAIVSTATLSGNGSAFVSMPVPLQPGTYEICNRTGGLIKEINVTSCADSCSIRIEETLVRLIPGQNYSLAGNLSHVGAASSFNMTFERWYDDGHTISMSVPPFLSVQTPVSLDENGSSMFNASATNAISGFWPGILVRASDGAKNCTAFFDVLVYGAQCGDGLCNGNENYTSCPADCPASMWVVANQPPNGSVQLPGTINFNFTVIQR